MRVLPNRWRLAVVAFIALAAVFASAQTILTTNAVMPIRMETVESCLVSVSDLDFGAYNSRSTTDVLGQTTIQLQCGLGRVAEIALDNGTTAGGNTSRRRLRQQPGTDRLDYDLYQDAGRTIRWGDRPGADTLEVTIATTPQLVTIYGKIPAEQRVRDGNYSDEITVSVFY